MNNARNCPICHQVMQVRMSHGIEIDLCGMCGGLWLDAGELNALLGSRFDIQGIESAFHASAKLPTLCRYCNVEHVKGQVDCSVCGKGLGIACPVDGSGMHIVKFGEIEFDRCSFCSGIWVDGFEREAMGEQAKKLQRERAGAFVELEPVPVVAKDWSSSSDWGTTNDWGGSGQDGGGGAVKRWSPPSLEVECSSCKSAINRYSAWADGDEFWCIQCLKRHEVMTNHGTGGGAKKSVGEPLQVACDGCAKSFNRYYVFAYEDEFWCMQCAERSDVKVKLEGVTSIQRSMDELTRKRRGNGDPNWTEKPNAFHLREDVSFSRYRGDSMLLDALVRSLFRWRW